MNKESIHWNDWYRILIGSVPELFLAEIFLRTIFMFLTLLIVLRLMGKRMGGQLTISELAVMLTLGAIICVPMQIPDRGVLQGAVVLICAVVFQRGLTLTGFKNRKIEGLVQGKEAVILKNGVLLVEKLQKANISRQQLYSVLRSQHIYNLGQIERIYLEACGLFSIFLFEKARPGLCIVPVNDFAAKEVFTSAGTMVCQSCGKAAESPEEECSNCSAKDWKPAIINL